MNFFKKSILLLLGSAVVFTCISCNKTDSNADANVDYSKLIIGHWFKEATNDNNLVELSIGAKGSNSASYYDLIDQDWGVMAFGTFELNGNKLKLMFNDVSVTDEDHDPSSRNGFTNKKSKTVNYTILSCDGETLVMLDEANNRSSWKK